MMRVARRRLRVAMFVAAAWGLVSPPALADVPIGAPTAAQQQAHTADWVSRLDTARQDLRATRTLVAELRADIGRMRRENYPRGDARAELLERYEKQQAHLAELELEFPELLEQARRAGVPAGILQDYEAP